MSDSNAPESAEDKKRLFLSFSGGKTSGYMTKMILDEYSDKYEILVMFANTGQENEKTLEFVNNCDKYFGFNTVWVEAVVIPELRKGTVHKVVDFESATRDGSLFEDMIKKYGIPNNSFPHCTRELKLRPMESNLRSIRWKGHETAIGIRTDEARRVSKSAGVANIIYPLVDWFPTDKIDVNDWWEEQDFNLELMEHEGNCKWCWKKSFKKHFMLINDTPEIYEIPRKMERLYPRAGRGTEMQERVFFRGKRSTDDLFVMAEASKIESSARPKELQLGLDLDENGGCSESCELYPTE